MESLLEESLSKLGRIEILNAFITSLENKEAVMQFLQSCLNEDPIRGNVVDITKLNIVEVTRKKIRKSLAEELQEQE